MKREHRARRRGFTLIELLAALFILSLLALMSYRGLGSVMVAREQVRTESQKWQRMSAFFTRFERDVSLSAPRPVRTDSGTALAWRGQAEASDVPQLEFSRFASADGQDSARRLGYRLNDKREIELWVWPGLDVAPGTLPVRYPLIAGVQAFELHYLDTSLAWINAWPSIAGDPPMPRAVRVRIVLDSGEELVRVFALET